MLEEVSSPDHSDQELNYRQFMELHKQTKAKRTKNTRSPKELQPLRQEAMKLFINGDLPQCKQKVMEMITLDPKNPDSYFLMGEVHELDKDKMRAAHYFSLSIELSVPNPRLWEKIGDLYFSIEFYQQAAYCYGRCLKSQPINGEVLLKRAKAYENGQEFRKALSMYYKLLKIGPDLNIIKDSARLHCRLGQFDKAREILRTAPKEDINVVYMICETIMKERKYQELVDEINYVVLDAGRLGVETLMPEFLKMVVVAGFALGFGETEGYFGVLMGQLSQDTLSLFEALIQELTQLGLKQKSTLILSTIINDPTLPKKPQYYLKLSQFFSSTKQFIRANEVLQKGRKEFPDNKNIRSQLGFAKIKIGDFQRGVEMVKERKEEEEESDEEIYISDLSEDEKPIKVSKVMKKAREETKVEKKKVRRERGKEKGKERVEERDEEYNPGEVEEDEFRVSIEKRISHLYETVELKQDEPHILLQFYTNINSLLKDVVTYYTKLKHEMYVETYLEEKRGLFSKKVKHRKRRTRAEHKENINQDQLVKMLYLWISHVYKTSCWYKIFSLSTVISQLTVLKKYPEERKRIYQLCILACLQFKRYRRAFFLLRCLLTQDPNNIFYILLCNVLIRKINAPKTGRFVIAKLPQHQNKYPNLSYLIAFEHLESGYFQHSMKSLLKIPPNQYNQENIMLCFVSCFVQLASSRNTTDKLMMVNRATYMLNQYRKVKQLRNQKSFELSYNLGRFYHQLRMSSKAIQHYQQAISIGREAKSQNLNKAVYSLLFLYKQLQEHQKHVLLSKQYFCI